jgi:hypothetical protein
MALLKNLKIKKKNDYHGNSGRLRQKENHKMNINGMM